MFGFFLFGIRSCIKKTSKENMSTLELFSAFCGYCFVNLSGSDAGKENMLTLELYSAFWGYCSVNLSASDAG